MKPTDDSSLKDENARLRKEIDDLRAQEENKKLQDELSSLRGEDRPTSSLWREDVFPARRVVAITALAGMVLAVIYTFALGPAIERRQAENELKAVQEQYGKITAAPASIEAFSGKAPANTNPEQKRLGGQESGKAPGFTFTNGKESGAKVPVELYVDFAEQKSVNFVLLNVRELKGLVENGLINLTIRPVPSSSPYSIYGPEALAEAFTEARGSEWDFFIELLKLSMAGQSINDSPAAQAKAIEKLAKKTDVGAIDQASVQNGTFAGWLLTGADASVLSDNPILPVATVDGDTVKLDSRAQAGEDLVREIRRRLE